MSSFAPWTLKGVPTESRNAAIQAAQSEGVPVGVWVGRACLEAAQRSLAPSAKRVAVQGTRELAVMTPEEQTVRTLVVQADAAAREVPPVGLPEIIDAAARLAALDPESKAARTFQRAAFLALRRQLPG
jgi:hypothetical protein